ncbi:MAG: hypothetical protein SVY53_09275 [Chloroflexota bacterium]|nr:hypothetical protein [Chloroflexota bacterium]
MSIVDSTTTLDTAWTEQSFVAFTAGTLSTVSEMQTEVEDKIKRGSLSTTSSPTSTSVQRWLVRAKEELMQTKSYVFARRYAYADLTEGTYRASLPPDFAGAAWRLRDMTNDFLLIKWPAHVFDLRYPDMDEESNGDPKRCCVKGRELWVSPPVDTTTRFELEYDRSGDDNTPTDFSFLPEIERFRCCDYAIYEAMESLHDFEKAGWFRQKWEAGLRNSRGADGRKKWSDMGFRAIGIMERETTRYIQG